jgi:hypothetical protein
MKNTEWANRGKTVSQLIKELHTFENQDMEVRISLDHGETSFPISLVGKSNGRYAVIQNCQDTPTPIRHGSDHIQPFVDTNSKK